MCPGCVSRRDFVRVAAAVPVIPAVLHVRWPARADWLLVPMDDVQAEHLKAYGLTFRAIQRGVKAEWLLNYRGGSFLLPNDAAAARDAALHGITVEGLSDKTEISTDCPAMTMSLAWPRMTPVPVTTRPAPAPLSCLRASRRLTRDFIGLLLVPRSPFLVLVRVPRS